MRLLQDVFKCHKVSWSQMSEQDYASTDLRRRPFHSFVTLLSLTTVVASTTFLFLFGNLLLDVTSVLTSTSMSSALGVFFESFIWSILLLVILLGIVVISSTISTEIHNRRKDIGLMKSIGTLMDTIFDHFMAQAMIILALSLVLGIATGVFLYMIGLLWLTSVVSNITLTLNFPVLQLGTVTILYLFSGYVSAQRPIYQIVNETPFSALNPDLGSRVKKYGFFDDLGLSFRLASKVTGRRVKGTKRVILALFFAISLASVLWIGGGVVESTTDAYIVQSMGENVVAIGNATLLEEYYDAYSLTGTPVNNSFDFLQDQHMIPSELMDAIRDFGWVTRTESRLLAYEHFVENPASVWNPTLEQYELVGKNRNGSALVVGLNWNDTISDWYYEGVSVTGPGQAWVGGQMATEYFEDPLIQSMGMRGNSLHIQGIAFDILNGGMVALIPLDVMQSYWGVSGTNLLLVQIRDYSEEYISQLRDLASKWNLSIYLQNDVLEQNLQTVHSFWSLLTPLPLIALFSSFLCLMNYVLASVFSRFRDYVIMRSVGAKPLFIAKTMIAEGIGIGLSAGVPAIFAATLFSIYLLVPDAVVPSTIYLPLAMSLMFLALIAVVILAAVPVYLIFSSRSDLRVSEFAV